MLHSDPTTITKIQLWTLDIPTTDPFVVATGQLSTAQNIIVKLTLHDGSVGFGEIAPFTDITGETVADSLKTAQSLATSLLGASVHHYRRLAQQFQDHAPNFPATRCGMETALLDALCRSSGIPLWALWGGADVRERETDITIPICDSARTLTLGQEWYERGFRLFKMKVGHDVDEDVRRIETLHHSLPNVTFLVDPNQGFTRDAAAMFIEGVKKVGGIIELLEQPLPKDDLEGAAWLSQTYHIPIAADESVQTASDAKRVIQHKAANYINLKITKSGVMETLDILTLAKQSHDRWDGGNPGCHGMLVRPGAGSRRDRILGPRHPITLGNRSGGRWVCLPALTLATVAPPRVRRQPSSPCKFRNDPVKCRKKGKDVTRSG